MTRKKDLECCDALVQCLRLTLLFSEAYHKMVAGSIIHFICKCSGFACLLKRLFFSFQYYSGVADGGGSFLDCLGFFSPPFSPLLLALKKAFVYV